MALIHINKQIIMSASSAVQFQLLKASGAERKLMIKPICSRRWCIIFCFAVTRLYVLDGRMEG